LLSLQLKIAGMKKNFFNYYIFATFMLYDFVAFAQAAPGDDDEEGEGGLESGDELPVPINGKLLWLAILGVLFAIYIYRNNKSQKEA
jgi:hypothetical protein